tara:strand:- start:623 stop:1471 length:849 start_codon:yes stop_codon:yes gene_type:complete
MTSLLDQFTSKDLQFTGNKQKPFLQRYVWAFKKCFPNHLSHDNRRGQLKPEHEYRKALYDTYNYQLSHMETLIEALKFFDVAEPDVNGLQVIDIGAGACTTRFAMAQHWPEMQRHIDYIAIEINDGMQSLGCSLSKIFGWSSTFYLKDIKELPPTNFSATRRHLITLSYVVGQKSVTDSHIKAWGETIKNLANTLDKPVEVLMTTARGFSSGWHKLYRYLSRENELEITKKNTKPTELKLVHRYPTGHQSPTFLKNPGSRLNVEMDFWTVTAINTEQRSRSQ